MYAGYPCEKIGRQTEGIIVRAQCPGVCDVTFLQIIPDRLVIGAVFKTGDPGIGIGAASDDRVESAFQGETAVQNFPDALNGPEQPLGSVLRAMNGNFVSS